jgi:hypothetical protein
LVLFGNWDIEIFAEFQKVALDQPVMYFLDFVKGRSDVGRWLVLLAVEPKNLL